MSFLDKYTYIYEELLKKMKEDDNVNYYEELWIEIPEFQEYDYDNNNNNDIII